MPIEVLLNEIYTFLPNTETVISSAIAKVYTSDTKQMKWIDSRLSGILLLIIDRSISAFLLRLYDISRLEMTFETELYYNFKNSYKILSSKFHSFPIPGGLIGLNFTNSEHAEDFFKNIQLYSPADTFQNLEKKLTENLNKNWVESMKSAFSMKKSDNKKHKIEISKPYAVQLVSRVEWDNERKEFILDSLPEELRKIFYLMGAEYITHNSSEQRHSLRLSVSGDTRMLDLNRKSGGLSDISQRENEKIKRKLQVKIYQSTPTESLSSNFGQFSQNSLKESELNFLSPNKEVSKYGSDLVLKDNRKDKLGTLVEDSGEDVMSNKKVSNRGEQGKSYGELYRELLKKGVAERHRELNQYGNSEFSSESSTHTQK